MSIWLLARGAGLSALVLLTVSTSLGALGSRRFTPSTRYLVQYLHRVAAGLGLAALGVHVAMILADSYADVGATGALVPFTSGYRPTAVALGSLAGYTVVAVSVLGLARGRMAASPRAARTWRAVHSLAYVGWGSAMVHGLLAGTDTGAGWVRLLYVLCFAAVATSVAARLAQLGTTRVQGVLR
jgi:methionine sulfoxide reductase heme-binding subunit